MKIPIEHPLAERFLNSVIPLFSFYFFCFGACDRLFSICKLYDFEENRPFPASQPQVETVEAMDVDYENAFEGSLEDTAYQIST